jgi:hypothetical protein
MQKKNKNFIADNQFVKYKNQFFLKKYFASMKKGCTFASAFEEKQKTTKNVDNFSRQENIEINEKTEIACVRHPVWTGCGHEDESKR